MLLAPGDNLLNVRMFVKLLWDDHQVRCHEWVHAGTRNPL